MWLDGLLLTATLAIALIGTTTQASDTIPGRVILSVLLVLSTGLSLWLKKEEARRHSAMQRGIKRLEAASLPTDEFVDSVGSLFTTIRLEEGYRLPEMSRVTRYARAIVMSHFLWRDDHHDIDSLVGLVVINERDLGQLAMLDERRLRKAVREFLVGRWGRDDLNADRELIATRVFAVVEGWSEFSDVSTTVTTTVNHDRDVGEILTVKALDENGDDFGAPVLTFSADELGAMFGLPALERGVHIARKTDLWLNDLAAHGQPREIAEETTVDP
jgi:hypothetical protein